MSTKQNQWKYGCKHFGEPIPDISHKTFNLIANVSTCALGTRILKESTVIHDERIQF